MHGLQNRRRCLVAAVLLVLSLFLAAGCSKGKEEENGALLTYDKVEALKITADEAFEMMGVKESDFCYGKVMVDFDDPTDIEITIETKLPGNVGVGISKLHATIAHGTILASVLDLQKLGKDMANEMRIYVNAADIGEEGIVRRRDSTTLVQKGIFGPETDMSAWDRPVDRVIDKPGVYQVLQIFTAGTPKSGHTTFSGDPDFQPKINEGMLRVTATVVSADLQDRD